VGLGYSRSHGVKTKRETGMKAVLHVKDVEHAFADRLILRGCSMHVNMGDRIGLVGANGSGKSTFLRIIGGTLEPVFGEIHRIGSLTLLDQEPVLPGETVEESAAEALAWHEALLRDYEAALEAGDMEAAGRHQARLDDVGWEQQHRIDALLDKVCAPPKEALVSTLSGGERRRVALARALLNSPDLLILDEPTNHLDAQTIEWLENFLQGYRGAVLLVTHDRYLLESVADRIVEVENKTTVTYEGSYGDYLIQRAERMLRLEQANARHAQLIRREAAWASRSPAARTGKQKARLNRLAGLNKVELGQKQQTMELDLRTGIKSGRAVLELHQVSKGYDGRQLFGDLDLNVLAGDRLGIIGPNGCGKSTLLQIMTERLSPDSGELRKAPRFRSALLNQSRVGLNETDSVFEAAGDGNDQVKVGDRFIHVASFLRKFLFRKQMFDQEVSSLSGGEKARLLLAKLLLNGCNLLLLDEPTNDLDLQTLRVLEDALLAFDGAMVVVTHDRAFLDRVCNRILAFEPDGVVEYADRTQAMEAAKARAKQGVAPKPGAVTRVPKEKSKAIKLTYKEKRELEDLPAHIEALELEQSTTESKLADPQMYRSEPDAVKRFSVRLEELAAQIAASYERWEQLSERLEGS